MSGNWAAVSQNLRYAGRSLSHYFPSCYRFLTICPASQTTTVAIDDVLVELANVDPVIRVDATEALERLRKVVHAIAPESLLIQPEILDTGN
jgi:hypothetical protein